MRQLDIFGGSQEAAQKNTRQGLFEGYKAFTDKFKPKLTTDDCYPPPAVYAAVLHWVTERCGLQGRNIVRPFYPGGDFERYPYENGAVVRTSFISNLFPGMAVMNAPGLLQAINEAQAAKQAKPLSRYSYPANVLTVSKLDRLNKQGIEFQVMDTQCRHISKLDSQRTAGKTIYGSGYLISDGKAAELRAAELRAAELRAAELRAAELKVAADVIEWSLSRHELEIIQELNKQDDGKQD